MTQTVRIAVDSPADIPLEWREKWNIAVIPAFVNFGTESFPDDGVSLSRDTFYKRLAEATTLPGTAAPPSDMAEGVIAAHLSGVEHVLVFTVAHQFSGLYNSIRLAGQRVDAERVTVVDSGTVTMAEGFQALAAAEVAARGGSKDECLAAARSVRDRQSLYALIDTLEYLRRGGRISSLEAGLGSLLQIKPILEVRDGTPETLNRTRTMGKGLQTLVEMTRRQAPFERLAIMHTNFPQGAEQLREQLQDVVPTGEGDNFMISNVTTAIGTHVGPGSLGTIFVRKK